MMPPAAFASMVISLVMQRVSRRELKELYRLRNRNGLFALLEKSGDFGNHFLDRGGWESRRHSGDWWRSNSTRDVISIPGT